MPSIVTPCPAAEAIEHIHLIVVYVACKKVLGPYFHLGAYSTHALKEHFAGAGWLSLAPGLVDGGWRFVGEVLRAACCCAYLLHAASCL